MVNTNLEIEVQQARIFLVFHVNLYAIADAYLPDTADLLSKKIAEHLAMRWSPEVIAGRLEQESGKQIISDKSIYKNRLGQDNLVD